MKIRWLALLLLAGCASPPQSEGLAPTDLRPPAEAMYLSDLYRYGHPEMDRPEVRESALRLGRTVCEVYEAGGNDRDALSAMIEGGASPTIAGGVAFAATEHLCPDMNPRA